MILKHFFFKKKDAHHITQRETATQTSHKMYIKHWKWIRKRRKMKKRKGRVVSQLFFFLYKNKLLYKEWLRNRDIGLNFVNDESWWRMKHFCRIDHAYHHHHNLWMKFQSIENSINSKISIKKTSWKFFLGKYLTLSFFFHW